MLDDADVVYIAFGTQALSARVAAEEARAAGVKAGVLRLITIWPFPDEEVRAACARARAVIVPEMNLGQARMLITNALAGTGVRIEGINHVDSTFITPEEILAKTEEVRKCH